jgi:hypothetical protein
MISITSINEKELESYWHITRTFDNSYQHELKNLQINKKKYNENGINILFSGCSVTEGSGIQENNLWTNLLCKQINKKTPIMNSFNIAKHGNSIFDSIISIFSYIKNNDKPDFIFLNLPNIERNYLYLEENKYATISFSAKNKKSLDLYSKSSMIHVLNYYYMLEEYCVKNNIKLFSFTWDHGLWDISTFSEFKKFNFDTFHYYEYQDLMNYIYEYKNNNNDPYYLVAKDGHHQGNAYHYFWCDWILKEILND